MEVFYWRDRNKEVDFVLKQRNRLTAIEVKTSRQRGELLGMSAFDKAFSPNRKLLVGGSGVALEDFFNLPAEALVEVALPGGNDSRTLSDGPGKKPGH